MTRSVLMRSQNRSLSLQKNLDLRNVRIIPVSATEGDNVTTKSENIPWYKGPALLPYLEDIDITEDDSEAGFYMPVQRVCRPDHTFRGFQGQIEAGTIKVGDEIVTLPSNETAHVKSIHVGDKESDSAKKGQPVTIQLDREVDVSRGCVLTVDSGAQTASSITATLLWMDDEELYKGKNFFFKLGTKTIPGIVTSIEHTIDVNTGEEKPADTLSKNEIAVCRISFADKIVVDKFKNHKTLGEFIPHRPGYRHDISMWRCRGSTHGGKRSLRGKGRQKRKSDHKGTKSYHSSIC